MALGYTLRATHVSTTNTTSYADAETTQPTANTALLCFIWSRGNTAVPSISTGYGLTWTELSGARQTIGGGASAGVLSCWEAYAGGSPSSSTFTVDVGGGGATGIRFDVIEISGADTTDFTVQAVGNNGTGTSGSVTLAAFGDATNNGAVAAFGLSVNEAMTEDATATWTEQADAGHNSPTSRMATETRTGEDTTVSYSWTTSNAWAGIAVEVKVASTNVLDEYGLSSETDTAQAFFADSNILDDYGLSSETDAAQAFLADSNVLDEYAFASETDAAQAFEAFNSVTDEYGFASETDEAQAFTAVSNILDEFGIASETDQANSFTADSNILDDYGFGSETDTGMPFNADSNVLDEYGLASETDAGMPFTASLNVTDEFGFGSETDTGMPFAANVNILDEFGFASETDTSMPFEATLSEQGITDEYGFASETDTAMPFTADVAIIDVFGMAFETDTAMPFVASTPNISGMCSDPLAAIRALRSPICVTALDTLRGVRDPAECVSTIQQFRLSRGGET